MRSLHNEAMTAQTPGRAEQGFAAFVGAVHRVLPGVLHLIPQTFIGFAFINSFTFGVDLVLLWLTHGVLGIAYPLAVSGSYAAASVLAFFLNKILNFRAHGNTGSQSAKYLFVIVSNYVIWILGFSSFLEWAGVHYQVARVTAACVEGAYIYLLARFWVFRPRAERVSDSGRREAATESAPLQPAQEAH